MTTTISCVDLFCGAGGLTHGFVRAGLPVIAGIDIDPACRFPYETNNKAKFIERDIRKFESNELNALFDNANVRILAGCAPCQPFSTYAYRYRSDGRRGKWGLLYEFARLVENSEPHIITMENVPDVIKHMVFQDFVSTLNNLGYKVWFSVVNSAHYGVPQSRRRTVLLASKYGSIELIPPTHKEPITVRQAIGNLPHLNAGEMSSDDRLHIASSLSDKNLLRIRASKAGGTWRDWPEDLVAACHRASSGQSYLRVYGRMEWEKPEPTMTTQCYRFGSGRFGHPEQDRAISLREAALLQSFPYDYKFFPENENIVLKNLGRLIGNAVPVALGYAIACSIKQHINSHHII